MISLKQSWDRRSLLWLFLLYVAIAVIASLQGLLHGPKPMGPQGIPYTEYNNYIIFKSSAFHLHEGRNLYQTYPAEYWDLYKYSPAFSLFFSLFAYLPDFLGLILWSLLNSLIIYFAIIKMPAFDEGKKSRMLLFCFIELLGSLQNAQSNGLMVGLILFTFIFLESEDYFLATFCIVASVYIKIFGAVGFALFLMYPNKKKMAVYSIFWFLFIGLSPMLITGFEPLLRMYKGWFLLLLEDHQGSKGLSLAGILESWFRLEIPGTILTLLGIFVFCLPLFRVSLYKLLIFRLLILSSVLLWCIAFNHKAESPTFIISIIGIAIWYYCRERNIQDKILMVAAFVLTTLSVSDLVPRPIREGFIQPYNIKGLMTVVIWIKVIFELQKMNYWKILDEEMKSTTMGIG